MRLFILLALALSLVACATRGQLDYLTSDGVQKSACETEYTWQPSVDKYAVEYILAYCAKQAVKQGHQVINVSLLTLDLNIAKPPNGLAWTVEYAKKLHGKDELSDKEYGYIIAYLDLGLNKSE